MLTKRSVQSSDPNIQGLAQRIPNFFNKEFSGGAFTINLNNHWKSPCKSLTEFKTKLNIVFALCSTLILQPINKKYCHFRRHNSALNALNVMKFSQDGSERYTFPRIDSARTFIEKVRELLWQTLYKNIWFFSSLLCIYINFSGTHFFFFLSKPPHRNFLATCLTYAKSSRSNFAVWKFWIFRP